MTNRATIDGNYNIVIQDSHGSEIIINTSDPDEIERKLRQLNQEQLIVIQNVLEAKTDFIFNHIKSILKLFIPDDSIPKNLTFFKGLSKEDIIGREEDLKELRRRLLENKKLSLINGMGGIGKTTLAAVYVDAYYDAYDHIAWLTIESSLEEAILANHDLLTNLKLQDIPPKDLLSACLNKLRTMSSTKPGLLVLDNATQRLGKLYDALPKAPNWHILVTSREIIEPFYGMELGFLTPAEAILLFKKHIQKYDKFTEEEIKSFVNEVEFHTLTIEILANSARKNRWEADTVRNAIIENAKAGISTSHSGYEQIDRIKAYLIQIFKISNVDEQ